MSDTTVQLAEPTATEPPKVRSLKLVQGVQFAFFRRSAMRRWINRHGHVFEINVPLFGRSVVISDPALVRSVCTASTAELGNVQPNLGNWFGPGSTFGLEGERHRIRRRLLAPSFHGRSLVAYRHIIEESTMREIANWPEYQEFRMLEPMNRITLSVILQIVFGNATQDAEALRQLGKIIGPYMRVGQLLAFLPAPLWSPRCSPWGRLILLRQEFNRVTDQLIDRATIDPTIGDRTDVLACLLRAGAETMTETPRAELRDELLTLVCAGHETTASALAWTFERLRRHPDILAELTDEIDRGSDTLCRATIMESLRARTVIDVFGRRVRAPFLAVGPWRIPHGRTVLVRIADLHQNPEAFPNPERFDPRRFLTAGTSTGAWHPFGGGTRQCLGAGFATFEMDVVIHTVLRHFRVHPTADKDEKSRFRGIAHIPKLGGRVLVNRRG